MFVDAWMWLLLIVMANMSKYSEWLMAYYVVAKQQPDFSHCQ